MLPINNFYTGEGSGVYIPELGKTEAAVTRAHEGAQRMQETKFADALRKREEMIRVGAVSPVDIIHEKLTKDQAVKIDDFQKGLKDTYAKYGGDIPTDVMLDVISKRNEIEGWQKSVQATEKIFLNDMAVFHKDEYKYRPEVAATAMSKYYDTGEYRQGSALKTAPINTSRHAIKNVTIPTKSRAVTTIVDGKEQTYYVAEYEAQSYDDPEVFRSVENLILSDGQYADNIKEQFSELSPEMQQEWFDKAEMSEETNPLIHYAANDLYVNEIVPKQLSKSTIKPDKSGSWIFNNGVWMSGGKQMATTGVINESFTIPQGSMGINLKGGLTSINSVPVTAQYIDQIANDVKPVGGSLPSTMTAKPVYITEDYVEWIVDNKKDQKFRWYDSKDLGADGYPTPRAMYESERTRAKSAGWVVEEVSPRMYVKYTIPPVVNVRTPRAPYSTSLKNFMGNDYESKMGWDKNNEPVAPPKTRPSYKDIIQ